MAFTRWRFWNVSECVLVAAQDNLLAAYASQLDHGVGGWLGMEKGGEGSFGGASPKAIRMAYN
jgi:hypothetical protein